MVFVPTKYYGTRPDICDMNVIEREITCHVNHFFLLPSLSLSKERGFSELSKAPIQRSIDSRKSYYTLPTP